MSLIFGEGVPIESSTSKQFTQNTQTENISTKNCPRLCNCYETTLNCIQAELQRVPPSIPSVTEHAELAQNSIVSIKNTDFRNIPNLKSIDLSENLIDTWQPLTLKLSDTLLEISLTDNKLFEFPSDWFPVNIQKIDLSKNQLKIIPDYRNLATVQELSIGYNPFTNIPSNNPIFPENIEILKINCFQGKKLEKFNSLKKLNVLDISCPENDYGISAKLETIGNSALENLSSLKDLNLSGNKILHIPSNFPKNLLKLNLSKNRISKINPVCGDSEELFSTNDVMYDSIGENLDNSNIIPVTSILPIKKQTQLSSIANSIYHLDLSENEISRICVDDFYGMKHLNYLRVHL